MGEVQVPAEALWRAQTQRAVENFPISGRGLERAQIRALGLVKAAAARVNKDIGVLDGPGRGRDRRGRRRGRRGRARRPLPRRRLPDRLGHQLQHERQRGDRHRSRTAPGVDVHPNDHVNASQSSNDVFPTTIHLAATEALATDVVPALEHLAAALRRRAADWADVVKAGRTHLMDAVPITLGQEAGGWATQVEYGVARVRDALPRLGAAPHRRHGGRHRAQRAARVRRGGRRAAARGHRARRAHRGARPHRGPGLPRRARGGLRRAAHGRGVALQDRQRHPLAELGAAHRARRAAAPRPATRQLDHAGQGQPGDLRGGDDGGRAGDRQRRLRRVLRHAGQPAAQRDDAGDGPQRAGVGAAAGRCRHGCWRTRSSTAPRPTSSAPASSPSPPRPSSRR